MSNYTAWLAKSAYCISLFLCIGCKIDRNREIDREKFTFKTGDDTELFFKNVRQVYYNNSVMPGNREVFRHPDRCTTPQSPCLSLAIVGNFDLNEAYILIETTDALAALDSLVITATDSLQQTHSIVLAERGKDLMLEFATQIYESMEQQQQLMLKANGGDTVPLFKSDDEREAFRVTLADYFRLTRIF